MCIATFRVYKEFNLLEEIAVVKCSFLLQSVDLVILQSIQCFSLGLLC